jgi:hypothetical protein
MHPTMTIPTVTEQHLPLERVERDPFIAALEQRPVPAPRPAR